MFEFVVILVMLITMLVLNRYMNIYLAAAIAFLFALAIVLFVFLDLWNFDWYLFFSLITQIICNWIALQYINMCLAFYSYFGWLIKYINKFINFLFGN